MSLRNTSETSSRTLTYIRSTVSDFIILISRRINNSRLRFFPGKVKSRWSSPFVVTQLFPHGAIKVTHLSKVTFKVNSHYLKPYIINNAPYEAGGEKLQLLKPSWCVHRYIKLVTSNKHFFRDNPSCSFFLFIFIILLFFIYSWAFMLCWC